MRLKAPAVLVSELAIKVRIESEFVVKLSTVFSIVSPVTVVETCIEQFNWKRIYKNLPFCLKTCQYSEYTGAVIQTVKVTRHFITFLVFLWTSIHWTEMFHFRLHCFFPPQVTNIKT